MKKTHLIGGLLVIGVILAGITYTLFSGPDAQPVDNGMPGVSTAQETPTPKKAVEPAAVTTTILEQSGLYPITLKEYETAALASRYPFIAAAITPEQAPDQAPDDAPFTFEPQLPDTVKLAEITIPAKNLTLVAVYTDNAAWCTRGFCLFNLYIKRAGGYVPYVGLNAAANSYLMMDDKSISLLVCSNIKGYRQWRLEDGALDRPIPANSPGHFVPLGIFKHDKIAACP